MKAINWIKANYWLTGILALATFLRIYHAGHQSLWLDEVLSMNDANPKLTFMESYKSVVFWEAFPHLYFFLLKWTMMIFGYTPLIARLFSAVIGVAGVYGVYLLARELFNRRAGLIAAALICVNGFHIAFSQEVRPYGLLFLFTVLAFYRLSIFIKAPSYRNAALYGLFAGLIINAHFFGLVTLVAQYLLLLFFLIKTEKQQRKPFFLQSLVAGLVTVLLILPTSEALRQITKIKSFWIPKPAPDSFTLMFREFFSNSELMIFAVNILIIFYFVQVFTQKLPKGDANGIKENKMVFSFVVLFSWFFISLVLPIIKSYLDVSMILSRYFINIVPVFVIVAAIAIDRIRSRFMMQAVVAALVVISLLDLFVVRNYYNGVSKTQLRELTDDIKARNPDKSKIVCTYSWVFPYFFQDDPRQQFEGKTLEDYIKGMKDNTIQQTAFWYADANSRPYALTPEDEAYLNEHFILREKLEYFDAWANYYVPKNQAAAGLTDGNIDLKLFSNVSFDGSNRAILFGNANAVTPFFQVEAGNYNLVINGASQPEKPINGENAHIKVRMNGEEIGNLYLSENPAGTEYALPVKIESAKQVRFQIIYDNDIAVDGQDRNVMIQSVKLVKK